MMLWTGLFLALSVAPAPQATELSAIRTIDLVQMSPDGSRVLFALSPVLPDGTREFRILDVATGVVESIDLGKNYYLDPRRNHDVVWTKDGKGLLFREVDGDGLSVRRWDLTTKTSGRLFTHSAGRGLSPGVQFDESDDGRSIAFVAIGALAIKEEQARKTRLMATTGLLLGQENGQGFGLSAPNEVWIWERATGTKRRVYSGPLVISMLWSPDGSKLALNCLEDEKAIIWGLSSPGGQSGHGIVVIDIRNGRTQKLRGSTLKDEWILAWSPDSEFLAIDSGVVNEVSTSASGRLGLELGFQTKLWTLDRDTQTFYSRNLALLDAGAVPRPYSFGNGGWFHWQQNGRIYFRLKTPDRTHVIAVSNPPGAGAILSDPRWSLSKVSFARTAELAACVRSSVNEPHELALIDLRTGKLTTVTSYNSALRAPDSPKVEPYRITNRFGYATDNWLIKPARYSPGTKYPLVILLYGFDNVFAGQPWMKNFAPFDYANLGMVVLLANYPHSDGASGEGRTTPSDQWRFAIARNPLASLEAAIDRLAAEGLVDRARVAICGFSYGAFLAQYAITHSSSFAAAFVNDGGTWNPGAYYVAGIRDAQFLLAFDFFFGGAPFGRGGDAMREFLPAYRFGGLAVPVLLEAHSGDAAALSYADVYLTARQEGTPIEAVVYDDKHIMTDPQRIRTSIARSTDWLRYWLLGTENPDALDKNQYVRWAELRKKLEALKAPESRLPHHDAAR
jgi:dipeptidyl aminopeptidase/acylaminoacyl peptidase